MNFAWLKVGRAERRVPSLLVLARLWMIALSSAVIPQELAAQQRLTTATELNRLQGQATRVRSVFDAGRNTSSVVFERWVVADSITSFAATLAGRYFALAQSQDLLISQDYLRTLNANSAALATVINERPNDDLLVLRSVSDDLRAKVRVLTAGPLAVAGGFADAVPVVVQVSDSTGKPVRALMVRWNPARDGTSGQAMFTFNNPTTPSRGSLPPGRYMMWLQAVSGEVRFAEERRVGMRGMVDTISVIVR